ncbi:MAG: TfoX/Sxy family protein [Propionibacteriaceae bacterium]|nr:TfoX/Sxy family protein [Propionibacteriaceae bacterium]
MTPEQTVLIERIRTLIAGEPVVREVSMFGGRSVMLNEKMILSALRAGGLLVRVDADQHNALLERSGAMQAEMGRGRGMGPGWIEVDAETIRSDEQLSFWVEVAIDYNRTVTGARS